MISPSSIARQAPFVRESGGIFEYRLRSNQLKILLAPDPSARVVAIVQHVRVGSRHEGAGNTGYAHLTEHEMFKGSVKFNKQLGNDFDWFMKFMGGNFNATTGQDRTNYFALVPSAYLRQYLAYEADRLVNAFITDADLRTEMPVVSDEFGIQASEPDSMLSKLLMSTMFTEHPYKGSVIGSLSDIQHVTAEALKSRFYNVYYRPNNVTLIVAGGFDRDEALSDIIELYGKIPPSRKPIPQPHTVEPPQFGERRFVINKPGDLPRLIIGFHIPQADHPDTHALQALSSILGAGPASRLHRKLVNTGLASIAYSHSGLSHDPTVFEIYAKLTLGTKTDAVERIILAEIKRISEKLVSQRELRMVRDLNRSGTVLQRANPLRFAKSISEAEAFADWNWAEQFDEQFERVSREDILAVARRYLADSNRTVGAYVPGGEAMPPHVLPGERPSEAPTLAKTVMAQPSAVSTPADSPATAQISSDAPDLSSSEAEVKVPQLLLRPQIRRSNYAERAVKRTLPNGLTVVLLQTNTEAIGVNLTLNTGSHHYPHNKLLAGVVSELLTAGSERYSKAQIADLTTRLGITVDFGTDSLRTTVNNLVPGRIAKYLDLIADVLRHPLFAQQELDLLKTAMLAQHMEAAEITSIRASIALRQALYLPQSIHYADSLQTRAAMVQETAREDLLDFHELFYGPRGGVLALVGKFDVASMLALIESKFGDWKGGAGRADSDTLARDVVRYTSRINVPIASKDNLTILVGQPSKIWVESPHYLAAMVANKALGGDTLSARLGKAIREERGLTYGVTSGFSDNTVKGAPWTIKMTTNRSKVEQAIPLIGEVVDDFIQGGIGAVELETEKIALSTAFDMQMDGPLSIARALSGIVYAGRDISSLDAHQARLAAVTKDEVDDTIRNHFNLANAVTVVAGNL